MDGIAFAVSRKARNNRTQQNCQERAAFDQRVAAWKLRGSKMIGQDAVFDRPKKRAKRSKQKQRDEQQRDRMNSKAQDRQRRSAHLDELDALRHPRLVVAVGDFAAEPRKKEIRSDEQASGERDQSCSLGAH